MLLNQLYYYLKPMLPWHLRIGLRRWRATRLRKKYADVWPIDPKAGATPPGWRGWPQAKKFAFVLTHDVEGRQGKLRVEPLMELERRHGFRSSFNFVAEGEYRLDAATRQKLQAQGFEVGVHGVTHDGKLYNRRQLFAARSASIRKYLQAWGASGFRSPLMQHRLSWLHTLGADYDASTFDTDPFEPEPDGVRTVFPFWVPAFEAQGYVELPYTLAQDFTLFVVLREKNIDIWKRKLDWIADHGGMALLNTHPDYMCFTGRPARHEYPVSFYEELLLYIRERYPGCYWAAQPGEVARYYCESTPQEMRNTRRKVCMLAYTFYEADNRVRRYAETLAARGDLVDVVALRGEHASACVDENNNISIYRIQNRECNESSKWTYAWRQMLFLWRATQFITHLHKRNRYDVVHIHNMPDALTFAAWYPKLAGAKLILDIHDLMPELFASKFTGRTTGVYVAVLKSCEKAAARFVDHVIVSNHLWSDKLVTRSVDKSKCSVFLNHVDSGIFYPRARTRQDNKFLILFPGSLQWHQGLDIAIEAFSQFRKLVPNAEFHIYGGGGGDQATQLAKLAAALGLNESVRFHSGVPLDKVPDLIANADLGVVPKRADSFGNEAYSTKIMEFMSQGVPVVASRTKIDNFYFGEDLVHFFESGNSRAMAHAMLEVAQDANLRARLERNGRRYAERNNWTHKKQEYLDLVDMLSTQQFEVMPVYDNCNQQGGNRGPAAVRNRVNSVPVELDQYRPL